MNSREITAEIRLAQWTQALKERADKGETIDEFCQGKGISRNTFFYRQRKVRSTVGEQLIKTQNRRELAATGFKEVIPAETARAENPPYADRLGKGEIRVEFSGLRITADEAYPAAGIAEFIRAVTASC